MTSRLALTLLAFGAVLTACADEEPIPRLNIPTAAPSSAVPAPTTAATATAPSSVAGPASGSGAGAAALPSPPPQRPPVPVECSPPSPEPASASPGSDLTFSGACAFTETSRMTCSTQPDDFILQFSRDTPDGPKIYAQANVEFYKGPGSYQQKVQFLFEIPDNGTIYEWDTSNGAATVDPGGRSGSFDQLVLPADPGTPSQGTITVNGTFACA